MSEKNGFARVAFWITGVEDQSGSGCAGLLSCWFHKAVGGRKAEALHGGHGAEVGLEFGGEEFDGAAFVVAVEGDGVSCDRVGLLPVPQRVGVVFNGVLLEEDSNDEKGDPQNNEGSDNHLVSSDLH